MSGFVVERDAAMQSNPSHIEAAPTLSVIIKALNEEKRIEACLRSVLPACAQLHGEVILADSLSTDRTVEIAARFNVKIVQLNSVDDRGCGAALQLGYQFARGEYIYVLDADMTLEPGFLRAAMGYLDAHSDVAAVGGRLVDLQLNNSADRQRSARYAVLRQEQAVTSLGGGGLYRRSAIDSVGYLAHRWLPACEEAELGARLRCAGWRLIRLPQTALTHCGHDETSCQMLRRLWRNQRMQAYGMFLRSALGRPWLAGAVKGCWFVFIAPALWAGPLALATLAMATRFDFFSAWGGAQIVFWGATFGVVLWRKKNWADASFAFISWHLFTFAAARGFFRRVGDPAIPIPARVVKSV